MIPQGLGTALKPAMELICNARKPLRGTVAATVLAHGTGALNVDACRLSADGNTTRDRTPGDRSREQYRTGTTTGPHYPTTQGRWPANVLFDEEAAALLDAQSGERKSGGTGGGMRRHKGLRGNVFDTPVHASRAADAGGASRFFYVAKASRRERGDGNTHPTVKPLALMRWLVTLVTPPGGVVFDPFAGSGTTGVACAGLGIPCILAELSEEYAAIIARRIDHALDERARVAPLPLQPALEGVAD